jgi:hypothetical protein
MPLVHAAVALAGGVQTVVQLPQWLTSVVTSTQVSLQQVCPAAQSCVGEQPGTQMPTPVAQIWPAGQSASLRQPAHWCVIVLQNGVPLMPAQAVSSLQPMVHVCAVGSQYWPVGQGSLEGRQGTHWPVDVSQMGPLKFPVQSVSLVHPICIMPPVPPDPLEVVVLAVVLEVVPLCEDVVALVVSFPPPLVVPRVLVEPPPHAEARPRPREAASAARETCVAKDTR